MVLNRRRSRRTKTQRSRKTKGKARRSRRRSQSRFRMDKKEYQKKAAQEAYTRALQRAQEYEVSIDPTRTTDAHKVMQQWSSSDIFLQPKSEALAAVENLMTEIDIAAYVNNLAFEEEETKKETKK